MPSPKISGILFASAGTISPIDQYATKSSSKTNFHWCKIIRLNRSVPLFIHFLTLQLFETLVFFSSLGLQSSLSFRIGCNISTYNRDEIKAAMIATLFFMFIQSIYPCFYLVFYMLFLVLLSQKNPNK